MHFVVFIFFLFPFVLLPVGFTVVHFVVFIFFLFSLVDLPVEAVTDRPFTVVHFVVKS